MLLGQQEVVMEDELHGLEHAHALVVGELTEVVDDVLLKALDHGVLDSPARVD